MLLVLVGVIVVLVSGDDGTEQTATEDTSTTTSTSTTTTVASTTTQAPVPPPVELPEPTVGGFSDHLAAAADWAQSSGLDFVGPCGELDSTADYGPDPWCAILWEDRGAQAVYRIANFPGGEFGYWVLVTATERGWFVKEAVEDLTGVPPF